VEVEKNDRELVRETLGAGDLGGEDLLEGTAVCEAGEGVDARLARLLLRPAERAQQRAGEDEREEHQRDQRQQAGRGDPLARAVLPMRLDVSGYVRADPDPRCERQRDATPARRRLCARTDEREPDVPR